jgi:hypothetical protein
VQYAARRVDFWNQMWNSVAIPHRSFTIGLIERYQTIAWCRFPSLAGKVAESRGFFRERPG